MKLHHCFNRLGTYLIVGIISGFASIPAISAEHRGFSQPEIDTGAKLFIQNCAACHGLKAEGTTEWKKPDANGKYPPPPLNGSAHAWHHPLNVLKQTIRDGGSKTGGTMPGFADQFTESELDTLIAYFQSMWPEKIYANWASRNKASQQPAAVPQISASQQSSEVASVEMTRLLQSRLGGKNGEISIPVETPVNDIYMTRFGSNYGYITGDGRYLIVGNMIDLLEGANLTDIARQSSAIDEINKVSIDDMTVFPAVGDEKAVLTVFTDTSCPYCKKLHREVSNLQQAGISVHYLPYPRGGSQGPGYQTMRQVWCATDRAKAMSIAKDLDLGSLPSGDCEAARLVDEGYDLGNRVGVTGTPSLFKSNGENIQGYVPYPELIKRVLEN